VTGEEELDPPFPPELASETMARLYERQGKPDKAAAVRALLRGAHVEAHAVDGTLRIAWMLRASGPHVLRVVRFGGGETAVEDRPIEGPGGAAQWTGPPGWACVAIGRLADGDRFVPIAHAAPVRI